MDHAASGLEATPPASAAVVGAYRAGACVRSPSADRKELDGPRYRKGWEVRFYATSEREADGLVQVLDDAGLKSGRPYRKGIGRWIVPLYGRRQVELVLGWVGPPAGVTVDRVEP